MPEYAGDDKNILQLEHEEENQIKAFQESYVVYQPEKEIDQSDLDFRLKQFEMDGQIPKFSWKNY